MSDEMCKCGHDRDRHWMGFGQPGTCSVTIDTRPVTAGGNDLHPCPCKGFIPFDAFGRVAAEDRAATVRLYGEERVTELEREANG